MLLQGLARSLPDTARGLLRPRQPTGTELAEIRYVEPPAATAGVRVRVILQTQWDAPTAGVIEGQLSPAMTTMVIGAFVVEHPSAMFFADAGICVQNGDAKLLNADGAHEFAGAKLVTLDCKPTTRLPAVTLPASMTKAS